MRQASECSAFAGPEAARFIIHQDRTRAFQYGILRFFLSRGQCTASSDSGTSGANWRIVRVPEYAACVSSAGPLTLGRPMSHQGRRRRAGTETAPGRNQDGCTRARETKADARNPAFLGWYTGGRAAPAALRRLRKRVFPAPPVLSCLRFAQGQRVQG